MSNPCLIHEWSESQEWTNPWTHCAPLNPAPIKIPAGRGPAVLQPDRRTAEAEAKRLAAAHPGKRFAIFEAVLEARTVEMPTHVTVGGLVFQHRQVPVLLAVDDNLIPF